MAIIHGLAILLVRVSFGLAMGVSIFGTFLLAFTLSYKHLLTGKKAVVQGLVAGYVGAVCVLTHSVFPLLPLGPTVEVKDVSQAPQHLAAGVLELGAEVETLREYRGAYVDRSGEYDHEYGVYPIVPRGWKAGQPIPLWEGHSGSASDPEVPSDSVAVLHRPQDTFREAIADAEERFNLTSSPSAPVIYWATPKVLEDRKRLAYILTFSAYLVWLVLSLLIRTSPPSLSAPNEQSGG